MSKDQPRTIAKIVTKAPIGAQVRDADFWRAQSYLTRLVAVEQIRQEYHGWKNKQAADRAQDLADLDNLA